jgi:simple sugar transport system permease protein
LLAQNNPLGVIVSAFLMAALHKGASDLDLETSTITRDFSKIIQSLVILGIAAQGLWTWRRRKP